MHRADGDAVTLAPGEPAARFAGEVEMHATLDAPLSDFNVMTRRDVWTHRAEAVALAAGESWPLPRAQPGMRWRVYCADGALSIDALDVPRGAAVLLDATDDPHTLVARVGSMGYLVGLWPLG